MQKYAVNNQIFMKLKILFDNLNYGLLREKNLLCVGGGGWGSSNKSVWGRKSLHALKLRNLTNYQQKKTLN